jgi:hypothetical protein
MAAQSKEVSLPPWGGAVAGATGAVMANAITYPLDLYVSYDVGPQKFSRKCNTLVFLLYNKKFCKLFTNSLLE